MEKREVLNDLAEGRESPGSVLCMSCPRSPCTVTRRDLRNRMQYGCFRLKGGHQAVDVKWPAKKTLACVGPRKFYFAGYNTTVTEMPEPNHTKEHVYRSV